MRLAAGLAAGMATLAYRGPKSACRPHQQHRRRRRHLPYYRPVNRIPLLHLCLRPSHPPAAPTTLVCLAALTARAAAWSSITAALRSIACRFLYGILRIGTIRADPLCRPRKCAAPYGTTGSHAARVIPSWSTARLQCRSRGSRSMAVASGSGSTLTPRALGWCGLRLRHQSSLLHRQARRPRHSASNCATRDAASSYIKALRA
jgi:hypothetical protein